jgi:hypothetical protein
VSKEREKIYASSGGSVHFSGLAGIDASLAGKFAKVQDPPVPPLYWEYRDLVLPDKPDLFIRLTIAGGKDAVSDVESFQDNGASPPLTLVYDCSRILQAEASVGNLVAALRTCGLAREKPLKRSFCDSAKG